MPNLISILLFFLISLPGFSQGETIKEPLSPGGGKVIIQGAPVQAQPQVTPAPSQAPATAPASNPGDDETMIEQLEAEKRAQIEKFQKIQKTTEPIKKIKEMSVLDQIKALGHDQINATALLDDKVLAILQKSLENNELAKLPHDQVKSRIRGQIRESKMEALFDKFPRLLDFFVDLIKDSEAMPGLLHILQRKDDLKTYFYIWLAIFIFSLFIKGRVVKPKWKFGRRLRYGLVMNGFLSLVSLVIFYSMFSSELNPTLSILKKYIL